MTEWILFWANVYVFAQQRIAILVDFQTVFALIPFYSFSS